MEKEDFLDNVQSALMQGKNLYQAILEGSFQQYESFFLNCSELVAPQENEKIPKNVINHFFSLLHKDDINGFQINKKACLYFFEIISHNAIDIKSVYIQFSNNSDFDYLNKSAIKKNAVCPNNILYIGKVKNGIGSRMATHFGYVNPKIGGMQLRHWAKEINLKLKVHIIAFDEVIDDYINPLELNLTKNLKPLIGKSK